MSSALYRKYRPKSFESVIGQEHITSTLKNQLQAGRIGHAYLFCGSRGVGKTSLARIFARAINCTAKSGTVPCGVCTTCKAMAGEGGLDIIEIDAASNNGVDDARDLREKVVYPPVNGRYKVYIIDEVHMLTGSAFNALLKTLEEPPAHVVFILATTEPHKLPATVLSRCMRFDFRLVSMQELFGLLSKIYQNEGKDFEDDALRAIAAAAEGSVRDAVSLADMCLMMSEGKLRLTDVNTVLGAGDEKSLALLDAVMSGDVKGALTNLNELALNGKSMNTVARELAGFARDLMVASSAPAVLETTLERLEKLKETAKNYSLTGLAALLQLFSEAEMSLKYSLSPRIAMEAAVVRAIRLYSLDLNALDQRLLRLEKAIEQGNVPAKQPSIPLNYPPMPEKKIPESLPPENNTPAPPPFVPQENTPPAKQEVKLTAAQLWGRIIGFFRKNSSPAFLQILGRQDPERVQLRSGALTVFALRENYLALCDDALLADLNRALLNEGLNLSVRIEKDSGEIDMEKEAEAYISEFGRDKINIEG